MGILRRLSLVFPEALTCLMRWRRCTVEALAEKTLTSISTIRRLRNDPNYEFGMDIVIAICVALRLPPRICDELLCRAGYQFKPTVRHIAFQQLLSLAYDAAMDLLQFNKELISWGLAALGQE